jgi:YbgC/YbaW family acyl-CoA thioester hydrolase
MSVKPFIYRSRVSFADTDASGRIHYIALLYHMDRAEAEFMRSRGIGYRVVQADAVGFPRVHVECDYLSVLVYDDELDIAVTVDRLGNSSFTLAFDISVETRPAARGKVTIVSIDKKSQKSCPLPEKVRAALV